MIGSIKKKKRIRRIRYYQASSTKGKYIAMTIRYEKKYGATGTY